MARNNLRAIGRRTAYLGALTAALVVGLVSTASPANANAIDDVLINTAQVDFALTFDGVAPFTPRGPGSLDWQPSGNTYTPHLMGLISMSNANGVCGQIRATVEDVAGNRIGGPVLGPTLCPANNGWDTDLVDVSLGAYAKATLHRVRVTAWSQSGGGGFVPLTSVYLYP
jgi:hypothetical protein